MGVFSDLSDVPMLFILTHSHYQALDFVFIFILFSLFFLVSQKTTGSAGPSVPFVPDPQQLDFSVPPPNFYPGHQAPPATLVTQVSQKSDADIEWEKKMAEFVQKTKPDRPKRDDLDAKINEHLNKSTPPSSSSKSGKKRRTFTDYPVTDEPIASKVSTSNSARGKSFLICSLLHENSISIEGPLKIWTEHSNCQIHSRGYSKFKNPYSFTDIFHVFVENSVNSELCFF